MFGKKQLVIRTTARAFSLVPESGCCSTTTLNRSERKNPLTFESYAEMRDLFRDLVYSEKVKAAVITSAVKNFCSGGDVSEIIEQLTKIEYVGITCFYQNDWRFS